MSSKSPFLVAASWVRALRGMGSRGGVVGGERSVATAPIKSGGKHRTVLFCSTFAPAEDADALRTLAAAEPAKAERRLVVSGGPVETPPGIKGVRLDKHHARELITLHNLAVASGLGVGNPVHRDGHDLLALMHLASTGKFDRLVLARGTGCSVPPAYGVQRHAYQLCGTGPQPTVAFDGRHRAFSPMMAAALELFLSGGAYAIPSYGLALALKTAADASDAVIAYGE